MTKKKFNSKDLRFGLFSSLVAIGDTTGMISESTFFRFVQLENFRRTGRQEYLAYRSRAAAVLAYCAGLGFPEIMALTQKHWMPMGDRVVLIEKGDAIGTRMIPVSPATHWAVGRYLAEKPHAGDDVSLFDCEGGLPLKQEIRNAIRKFGAETTMKSGDLRASFELHVLKSNPSNPLAYYLVGIVPPANVPDAFATTHPPLAHLERLLRDSHPVYEDVRGLWQPT